ncbi:MAG TPA: hypothetical protein VNQ80_12320 [Parapedobacter sp.]|uniref:hypothetical protein n=1 Tax=Parapedobacter sp. TaxID=1958893 RepID=UPI002D0E6195|nr:hypothetical protein [Parapedobacter sp.]HWK58122.1 hypothetical protein [Parapedobacter sp.]
MIVLIDIKKPMLREYLHSQFAYESDAFSVFRHNTFGKALCALVSKSDLPVKHEPSEKTIRIRLPNTKSIRSHRNHFLYYTTEDQLKLNDLLDSLFDIDFESYYQAGIRLGMMQKDVIHNFIINRKLVSMIGDVETLKKRQYRKQRNDLEKLSNHLLQKIHYRDRLIKSTLATAYRLNASPL